MAMGEAGDGERRGSCVHFPFPNFSILAVFFLAAREGKYEADLNFGDLSVISFRTGEGTAPNEGGGQVVDTYLLSLIFDLAC